MALPEERFSTDSPPVNPVRIALIHALSHSVVPINAAFAQRWQQAQLVNLLDDSLSADLASNGRGLDAAMHLRFQSLANYAIDTGAHAILFTCSAFGSCIDAVAQAHPGIPIYPPNSAMIHDLTGTTSDVDAGEQIGLIVTFAPTLKSMPSEFPASARLRLELAEGALQALNEGDVERHDQLIAQTALKLKELGCTRIALAQFSMARARGLCEATTGLSVYTTVDSAVDALRRRFCD